MNTGDAVLTQGERGFRLWMRISFWMYLFGAVFFFVAGKYIPPLINAISARICSLPLYPLPFEAREGAFWLVLSVSMMAMLTWICRAVYMDVRGNGRLVALLLLSKLCSTALYFVLFVKYHYLAYLVGALTDGPIFVLTWGLWFLASPQDKLLNRKEEEILAAVGDALMPRDGAFPLGYLDLQQACLAEVRRMLAAQGPLERVAVRLSLRWVNLAPVFVTLRPARLCGMPPAERSAFLRRAEGHWFLPVRLMVRLVKAHVIMPFFNQPEAMRAIGYNPEAHANPGCIASEGSAEATGATQGG